MSDRFSNGRRYSSVGLEVWRINEDGQKRIVTANYVEQLHDRLDDLVAAAEAMMSRYAEHAPYCPMSYSRGEKWLGCLCGFDAAKEAYTAAIAAAKEALQ